MYGTPDYVDDFRVAVAEDRTAEAWARTMLEDAPARTRASLLAGWTAIGLTVDVRTPPHTVLGWEIRSSEPDRCLLGAGSRIGMPGELLFECEPGALRF